MSFPEIAAIAGPTAVGKTALSLALAERHPFEIVSVDSMQVYRRLDIGTAKPTPEERAQIPHHLIDVASPEEKYDLARYLRDASNAIDDIRLRGKMPLLVGGTGLYLKALMNGIFDVPSRNPAVREQLQQRMDEEGLPPLFAELAEVDPPTAQRLSPNDAIRIIRALEVFRCTGKPMSYWHGNPDAPHTPAHPICLVVLHMDREELNKRIEQRTRAMLQAGWVEEVRALLAEGLPPDLHCFKALGYRQIIQFIQTPMDPEMLMQAIARETRQFAKRQMTWFRAMPVRRWIDVKTMKDSEVLELLEEIFLRQSASW